MRFTDEHDLFRSSVAAMLAKTVAPHLDDWEDRGRFPGHDLFPEFAKLGLLGLEYDPAYGGEGADHWFTVIACEEFGRLPGNGIPMAYNVQANMATPSLHAHGSDQLRREFLAPAIAGEQICSIAVTEPDAGSDVAGIRTKAARDGGDWLISGAKTYITNGVQADWLCLLVRTSDEGGYRGMSQVIVPTDTPGLTVSRSLKKLGNWCSDTAELTFDRARVPVSNTIGEVGRGFHQQMEQFQTERICAVYQAVGQMETAIERTVDYLSERPAFGGKLIDNQYLQYNLAELACEVDAVKRYAHSCAELIVAGADVTRRTSSAKLLAGKLIRRVSDTCLQYHGGIGYMAETWTSRFFRDSRLLSIGGGADEVMLRVLSRDVIDKTFFNRSGFTGPQKERTDMTAADTTTSPPEQAERVTLTKDHDAHIARITICNPAKKNAMAPEDCELMGRHLDDIAEDDAIKVVLVRGEGGVFTTGVDLNRAYGWYNTPGDDRRPSQRRRLAVDRKGQRMFHDFIGFPKATIVQVESYALGLGLELALAADLAVVSRQAKLGMPAARFLGPVLGNVALFMHRLGPVVARDLMLTGRMATGAEFESARLFTRFVDEEDVVAETEALAAQVAKMPADGIAIAKEAYRLVEASSALGLEESTAYLFHSYGTNLRFEPDEFNFVKERSKSGTSEAFRKRDEHYGQGSQR